MRGRIAAVTDDSAATIRRLRAELHRAHENIANLERRLAYADEQIRQLRAKVPTGVRQAAAPEG